MPITKLISRRFPGREGKVLAGLLLFSGSALLVGLGWLLLS